MIPITDLPPLGEPVPGCPDWCTLRTRHEYEEDGPDGDLIGYHEGDLATLPDSNGGALTVTLAQQVTRTTSGDVAYGPKYVTLTTSESGTEYSDPHALRDVVDALRAAAGHLD